MLPHDPVFNQNEIMHIGIKQEDMGSKISGRSGVTCAVVHTVDKQPSIARPLLNIVACLLLGGCAVHNPPGAKTTQFSVDKAAVFGTLVEEFLLPDGSEASIRRMNDQYSMKLQRQFRVIELGNANSFRFKSAQMVDGYTLVVLQKVERNCPAKNVLLAIRGAEIRQWEIGNCRSWADTALDGKDAIFDFEEGRDTRRYHFAGGKLNSYVIPASLAPLKDTQLQDKPITNPSATIRTTPPIPGSSSNPETRTATAIPVSNPRPSPAPNIPTSTLNFKPREIQPRIIYLDK